MKTILIPTDFSSHARYNLEYVLNLVRDTQVPCKLLLVNTYMVQQTDPREVISLNDELKQISKKGLELEKQHALRLSTNPNIQIETASHMGSLGNVVVQLLRRQKIDLVAMGKNGGKHVDSIATLLKQHKCPLLITYEENSFEQVI